MKARTVLISNVIVAFLAGLFMLWRELWLVVLILPFAVYSAMNKPSSKSEQEELEQASGSAFAAGILIPAGLLLVIVLAFVVSKVAA